MADTTGWKHTIMNPGYKPGGFGIGTIFAFMTLYSPYIISTMALLYSIITQSMAGMAYLTMVTTCCALGHFINKFQGPVENNQVSQKHTFCPPYMFLFNNNPIEYPNLISLNSVYLGFTFGYIIAPMMKHSMYNKLLLATIFLVSMTDLYSESIYECINGAMMILIWVIVYIISILCGWLGSWIAEKHNLELFFITNKDNWICSKPNKKQQLKCKIVPKKKISISN